MRTPVTASSKVAVTVKAPFVGFGAPVVRTTVGAVISTVNAVTARILLALRAVSVTVTVQFE